MTHSPKTHLESALKAGLSAKAAAVYIALLEAGTAVAPKNLITRTRLHRQYVYDALTELKERGLVIGSGETRRVRYQAMSPDRLSQEAEKNRMDVLDGVRDLMRLYDRSPAGVVEVLRGSEAVIHSEFVLLEQAEEGGFIDIVGGAGMNWVRLFESRIEEWEALRRQKRLALRYIGTEDDVRHNREESMIRNESRIIPGIGNVVNVVIRPDSVTFNIYEPEILAVRVKNEAAVASQRALFEVLWAAAKER